MAKKLNASSINYLNNNGPWKQTQIDVGATKNFTTDHQCK